MNFWRHITGFFKRETHGGRAHGAPRAGALPLFSYGDQTAMGIATVFRCVKLLSESVASLPLQYLVNKGGIFVDAGDHRLDYLLNVQPDYALSAFDFWRQVVQELLLDGNAYIVPVYDPADMALSRLALCGRGTVAHDTFNDLYSVNDPVNGVSGTYGEEGIIHIKGLTLRDPKRGVGVLAYARLTMAIAATGDRETHNRFATGGTVRGIVSNGDTVHGFGEYQDEQLEKLARMVGIGLRDNGITSMPGQVDFKQISLSSADMQFLESRKFTVRELCRFFGVHPSFVFDDTSNNYKSAEQANVAFLSHTLAPLLRNIEAELSRKLVAPALGRKYQFRFDRRGLHACDLDGLMRYRTGLLQTGTTVNEVRRMENLPPVEGGDTVLVSANLRGINETGVQPQQQEAPDNNNKGNDDEDEKE